MKRIFTLITVLVISTFGFGQSIYSTDFGTTISGAAPSPFNPPPTAIDPNITTTGWTGGNIFFGGTTGGAYCNSVSNGNGTYTLTLNVNTGYNIDISSISFQMRRTSTGPSTVNVSVNSTPYVVTGAPGNGSFAAISASGSLTGLTGTVTITIVTSGGTGTGQNNRLDDFSVTGLLLLPIKLTSFQANTNNNTVNLNWKVTQEVGIKNYEVEKSNDGITFNKVGTVNANGNPTYNYNDIYSNGISYYKLKINETNGATSYSATLKIKNNGKAFNLNNIYPTPATSTLNVNVSSTKNGTVTYTITDITGKIVANNNLPIVTGTTDNTINVTNLKAGMYYLKLVANGVTINEKFVKQ